MDVLREVQCWVATDMLQREQFHELYVQIGIVHFNI